MSRLTRRAMLAPKSKTYADFQAHIAAKATNGSTAWGSACFTGLFRTTSAAATGGMTGSSWADAIRAGLFAVARAVQHGLPSQAEFNAQVAAGREIYFEMQALGDIEVFNTVSRNGFTSDSRNAGVGPESSLYMTDLIYWDGVAAQRMNPSAGTGPTPYDWP